MKQKFSNNPLFEEWLAAYQLDREFREEYNSPDYKMETAVRLSSFHRNTMFEMRTKYSFAIPCDDAIEKVLQYSPLVEIGAGNGYWANVIASNGGDVVAYDHIPPRDGGNVFFEKPNQWFDVQKGGPERIAAHRDRTLFICWPEYREPMAYDCVKTYKGRYLIYVGEGWGGCTGDDKFHELLKDKWNLLDRINIPQWDGIHDFMYVYRRKRPQRGSTRNGTGQ